MTAYLFHADAIAELLVPRPRQALVAWLRTIPREEQYTSAVSMSELYRIADAAADRERHLRELDSRLLPAVTVLPFDVAVARVFGELRSSGAGTENVGDRDLQVAATALYHDLEFVTARPEPFAAVPGLRTRALPAARRRT